MSKKGKRTNKTGLPPGSLVYTGHIKEVKTRVEFICYDAEQFSKQEGSVEQIPELRNGQINWVKVTGLDEITEIEKIGKQLDLNHLLLEDILNINQRPGLSEYNKALFISLKALHPNGNWPEFRQLSFVLTSEMLLSFAEEDHSAFKIIEERLSQKIGKIRQKGIDYLLHAFLDVIVDQYNEYLDTLTDAIELYDEKVLKNPTENLLLEIQQIRKQLIEIDRLVSPLRDVLNQLISMNEGIIVNTSHPYYRDVLDHLLLLLGNVKSDIELTSSSKDFYVSRVSLNMNKVIQLLTIFSVIFMPLTFLAGVYGMNFENMPELRTHYGYFVVLGVMFLIFIGMLILFRRKKWL
ncbi:MAG: magnesium and cobalt transport protein CorA [Bacteroidetes bacterium GWF2_42_66]|nr:MAG: magnesium and cobalt transport protein CorA [Bacteroidetes bacterium GWA2_42_15]OFX99518.1 MAG: magnesium and cobalt transport protein CorA [Bacteroidetes bacterium GWE2_42_39]OFY47185.1 MAG: magnesium and cobalt transport protein CorA [Bacteroidetes bacterium GWF2_42_66]